MISRISLRARDFLWLAALGFRTEKLRLYRHVVNGVLLMTFVLAYTIRVVGKELYEFLAVTKVDVLPPAPSGVWVLNAEAKRLQQYADRAKTLLHHAARSRHPEGFDSELFNRFLPSACTR